MPTKSTLEALVIAQKLQLEQLGAKLETTPQAPKKAPAPLVSRGYFKAQGTDGKWHDDASRPCILVAVPGVKPRKMTPETFNLTFVEFHARILDAYTALDA